MAFPDDSGSSRTTLSNILKTVYHTDRMYRAFNRKRVLFNLLKRKTQHVVEGGSFKIPVHTGGSNAGAHVAEGGTVPTPQAQTTSWLNFTTGGAMKTYLRPIKLSGEIIEGTQTTKAAVVKAADFAAKCAVQDALDDFNLSMFTPMSGLLTVCQEAAAQTVDVENPRRIKVGMTLSIGLISNDDAYDPGYDGVLVTGISGNTVTFSGGPCATHASIVPADSYGNSLYGVYLSSANVADTDDSQEVYGLEDIVNNVDPIGSGDVNYAGISRGTVESPTAGTEWGRGQVLDAKGQPVSDELGAEAADLVESNSNGETKCWITTPEILREIIKISVGDKRAGMKEKVGDGWFRTARLANLPVYADKHAPARAIIGLDLDNIWIAENKALGWETRDGSMWHRLETVWAYQALMTRMWQIVAMPNCHVQIKNVYQPPIVRPA